MVCWRFCCWACLRPVCWRCCWRGADGYQRLTQRDQEAYAQRTAAQYLATRIRQADTAAGITVEPFGSDGPDALLLHEQVEGTTYVTRVYCYEGYLRELFSAADAELLPADGEKILEMQNLTHFQ